MKRISQEQWDQARELLAQGKTQKEVAEALGCTQANVSAKLGKRREKKPEPAAE